MPPLLIYGANGYTGKMAVERAISYGQRPVLAGRSLASIEPLAKQYDLPVRAFALDDPNVVKKNLEDMKVVLHCAGPFSATSKPMLEACLETGTHYLDITGEISVFAHCQAQDERAKKAGIVVLPGSGFDVVPTDCMAAMLKRDLPTATHLVLAFEAGGGPSPGTAKTSVEGLAGGGRARIDGVVTKVPLAWKVRTFERDGEQRMAMTIPWGDVFTAFISTGIPNIETYMGVPPSSVKNVKRLRMLGPILGLGVVQNFLKKQVAKKVHGPSEEKRKQSTTTVWGEARDADGKEIKKCMSTPNGYELTVTASLGIVKHLLEVEKLPGGYYTPSMLMGPEYVLGLPDVKMM
ncbi:MAG: saccharopine dehydrogenase NADP-binding domain-containing protein [Arenimonas sp.]